MAIDLKTLKANLPEFRDNLRDLKRVGRHELIYVKQLVQMSESFLTLAEGTVDQMERDAATIAELRRQLAEERELLIKVRIGT